MAPHATPSRGAYCNPKACTESLEIVVARPKTTEAPACGGRLEVTLAGPALAARGCRAGGRGRGRGRRRVALRVLDLLLQPGVQLLEPVEEGLLLLGTLELGPDLGLQRRVELLRRGRLDGAERLDQVVAELGLDRPRDDVLGDVEGGLVELR